MFTLNGRHEFPRAAEELWDLLMDPSALRRSLPGCERLDPLEVGERYDVRIRVGVGLLKGRFRARVELQDLDPPSGCLLSVSGSGLTGTVAGTTRVLLAPIGTGSCTELVYEGELAVRGALSAVRSQSLHAAAKAYLDSFFAALGRQ